MGRRSRKRSSGPAAPRPARTPVPSRPASASASERPRALWHPVPVTEIGLAVGLGATVVGVVRGPRAGNVPLIAGLVVCGVLALELAAREHFTGFRSHALFLAAGPTVALEAILYAAGVRGSLLLAIAAPVFVCLGLLFRSRWREASELRALRSR